MGFTTFSPLHYVILQTVEILITLWRNNQERKENADRENLSLSCNEVYEVRITKSDSGINSTTLSK